MARQSQHSVNKRKREQKKAEKAEQKRARRAYRKDSGMMPDEPPESTEADLSPPTGANQGTEENGSTAGNPRDSLAERLPGPGAVD